MKKVLLTLLLCSCVFALDKIVGVSIAPYKALVEKICPAEYKVLILSSGMQDPHTFEPTIKEMQAFQQSHIWFLSNESFENGVQKKLQLKTQTLSTPNQDPHTFLSCKQLKAQVSIIVSTLSTIFPDDALEIEKNGTQLLLELSALDLGFEHSKGHYLMTLHDCFYHVCKDYQKTQIAIEKHGKETTFLHLDKLLKEASSKQIKVIFTQPQYSQKSATQVAKKIGADLVELNIYQEDLFQTLHTLLEFLNENSN